ncbi:hypothetical protein [Streptomyces sp. NPDC096132]|uniref:hypothetical protein n=1 Tax=Streptomyces sp. NPDC096132 TaxID=3366075 RepID=UPI0037FF29B2
MTTETTAPPTALAAQANAIAALTALLDQHPGLPAAYFTVETPHYGLPARLDIQLHIHEFEPWREALGIDTADVQLHVTVSNLWVSAELERTGVPLHVTAFANPLTPEQHSMPREQAEVTA